MPSREIGQIDDPSPAVFSREILPRRRPVILRNAMADWPALEKWSIDYLTHRVGQRNVRVTHSPSGVYDAPTYVFMKLTDFFERIANVDGKREGQYYITGIEIAEMLPELSEDVRVPAVIAADRIDHRHLFIGRDTATGGHFHPRHHALLAQIAGEKRVVLFAPSDSKRLYLKRLSGPFFNHSRIADVRRYDRRRYPRVEKATPIEVVLRPGAMLHIPIHWWHFVYGEGFSASLTFFWPAPLRDWAFPHPGIRSAVRVGVAAALRLVGAG